MEPEPEWPSPPKLSDDASGSGVGELTEDLGQLASTQERLSDPKSTDGADGAGPSDVNDEHAAPVHIWTHTCRPPPSALPPTETDMHKRVTLYLVRHGARFDFANKGAWQETCARLGHEASDPPLSSLGHGQARETAAALAASGVSHILVSPYLRCLQTAQPLAHACSKKMCIEEGLSELAYSPTAVPGPGARVAYFSEVDDTYAPLHPPVVTPPAQTESNLAYLRRMLRLAEALPQRFPGGVVACFSHAASVALVAALTRSEALDTVGCFAPCGIWKLVTEDGGATWRVEKRGDDNSGHVTENAPSTFPWGFRHSETTTAAKTPPAAWEEAWKEARRLGPTNEPANESRQCQSAQ